MTTGYSGTPLAKKLGLKDGMTVITRNSPKPYEDYFPEYPLTIDANEDTPPESVDFIHIFCSSFDSYLLQLV